MEDEIRALLLKYGIVEVHDTLKRVCQQMYLELGQLYGPTTNIDTAMKVCSLEEKLYIPTPSMRSIMEDMPEEMLEHTEVKPECMPYLDLNNENEKDEETDPVKEVLLPKRVIKKKKAAQEEIQVVPLNELVSTAPAEDQWASEQTRMKAAHRKTIQDKLDELTAKGVDPNTLLTKENLQSWIGEGKTYNSIARDIGLHESIVSKAAKEFGIETKTDRSKIMKWVAKGRRGGKS
jgi:hypothetical protein